MIRLLGDDSRSYKTFVDIVIQVPASSERRLPGVHSGGDSLEGTSSARCRALRVVTSLPL